MKLSNLLTLIILLSATACADIDRVEPEKPPEKTIVSVYTGKGETKLVLLPDSSLVTLNAVSSLTYPKDFLRAIDIVGSAIIFVRDAADNFVVKSHDVIIRTKNGQFATSNYNTYYSNYGFPGDAASRLVVQDGEVTAFNSNDSTVLGPGDAVEIRDHSFGENTDWEFENEISWASGYYFFENITLINFCKLLERHYKCQINPSLSYPEFVLHNISLDLFRDKNYLRYDRTINDQVSIITNYGVEWYITPY